MPKYQVLMTINQWIEVESECAEDAEADAWLMWKKNLIEIDESPFFVCDEVDLIEEE